MQMKVIKPHCLHGSSKSFLQLISSWEDCQICCLAVLQLWSQENWFQNSGRTDSVFMSVGKCGNFCQELYVTGR